MFRFVVGLHLVSKQPTIVRFFIKTCQESSGERVKGRRNILYKEFMSALRSIRMLELV